MLRMMFLSPKKLPIENIERLYGIHESYINQLVSRYDEDLIPCLLAHICQPAIQGTVSNTVLLKCIDLYFSGKP